MQRSLEDIGKLIVCDKILIITLSDVVLKSCIPREVLEIHEFNKGAFSSCGRASGYMMVFL